MQIERGSFAIGAEANPDLAGLEAMAAQMGRDGLGLEGFDAQAEMIDIVAVVIRRPAAFAAERPTRIDEIDHRPACPQMQQPELRPTPLDGAADDLTVEALQTRHVAHAQHHMVEAEKGEGEGSGSCHGEASYTESAEAAPRRSPFPTTNNMAAGNNMAARGAGLM